MKRDISEFLRLIKRAEKKNIYQQAEKTVRLAVIGKNSVQYIGKALRYLLYERYRLNAVIFEGDYDGIEKTLLDDAAEYYAFQPEATVILPDSSVIDIEFYQKIWSKTLGHIFQSNFVVPNISVLGNLEMNTIDSRQFQVAAANLELVRQKPGHVTILDLDGLASRIGKDQWFDYPAYFSTKQGFSLDALEDVCSLIARQIGAMYGKIKKCLVLDLDHTLWGGVVGDDGWDGIQLDPNDSIGEAYRFFQKYVLLLKERGVILAVCSKNELQTAEEPFIKNRNMVLRLSDIACFVANWDDKAANICTIASRLNIGIDSLVFFDDNPAEREFVRSNVPQVEVIDVPEDPAYYAKALSDSGAFDWLQITQEDLSRSETYRSDQKREQLLSSFVDYEEYLSALEMEYEIGFLDRRQIPRFTQLINKTNQFNLRTQRYTEEEIRQMLEDPQYKLIYASLSDKFDQYGLISCVILKGSFIDTWVMSCRVFRRHVEDRVFEFLQEHIKGNLYGEYLPTAKNAVVKDFYSTIGFRKTEKEGVYVYERI